MVTPDAHNASFAIPRVSLHTTKEAQIVPTRIPSGSNSKYNQTIPPRFSLLKSERFTNPPSRLAPDISARLLVVFFLPGDLPPLFVILQANIFHTP